MLSKLFSYSWVKENLSMVILIPTVLGGGWQIMELGFIGAPYIRFFSVSQLVSDGLLISFILFWFVLIFKYCLMPLTLKSKKDKAWPEDEVLPGRHVGKRIWIFVVLIFQGLLIWINLSSLKVFAPNIFKADKVTFFELMITEVAALTVIVVAVYAIINMVNLFKRAPNFNVKIASTDKVLKVSAIIMGVLFLLFSFYTLPLFHKSFAIINSFRNTEHIACQLKKENKNLKSFEILYFNDQYIFIGVREEPKNYYIEVKKFDAFFDKECLLQDTLKKITDRPSDQ